MSRPGRRHAGDDPLDLDDLGEILTVELLRLQLTGDYGPEEIAERLRARARDPGVDLGMSETELAKIVDEINRNTPTRLFRQTIEDKRLRYISPMQERLRNMLRMRMVEVAIPGSRLEEPQNPNEAVADRAASRIIDILRDYWASGKDEVRIGISGGHTMRLVGDLLGERILQAPKLPKMIRFYGLTASFDSEYSADVRFILTTLQLRLERQLRKNFDATFQPIDQIQWCTKNGAEREIDKQSLGEVVENEIRKLDLVVSSAADAQDEHSQFAEYLGRKNKEKEYEATAEHIRENGWIGDMLWQPIDKNGRAIPFSPEHLRPVSLLELEALPAMIARGTRVMLVATRCMSPGCKKPKTRVVKALIRPPQYITDLVVGIHTAQGLLEQSLSASN